jgi:hypothetical protein
LIDGFKTTIPEALGRSLIDLAVKMDDVFGHRLTSHARRSQDSKAFIT